jgi:hypothetical protein
VKKLEKSAIFGKSSINFSQAYMVNLGEKISLVLELAAETGPTALCEANKFGFLYSWLMIIWHSIGL